MKALDALARAARTGDVEALAPAYARNAVLDANLPGSGRKRHDGRAGIAQELARWWPGPGNVHEWHASVWPAGAAVTMLRDGVRTRHYLHASGDLIARHWAYGAAGGEADDAVAVPAEVLAAAGDGAQPVHAVFAGGNSGASVERIELRDGTPLVAKRVTAGADWLGRAMGGTARTAELWRSGTLARVPAVIDHGIESVVAETDGDGWWVVMRDVSAALLGDERRLSRTESRRVLDAAAALHRTFAGDRIDDLATLAQRIGMASPAVTAAEREGSDLLPKQFEAAWDAFSDAVDDDVSQAVLGFVEDPDALAARIEAASTSTLLHGDLRDDNLGFESVRVVLLDWDIAAQGPPAVEFAWYLCHDAWRIDASHDQLVADFRAAEGDLVDDGALAWGLISGLVQYGWIFGHSAVVHPDPAERAWAAGELAWWVPAVRSALERVA